MLAPRVRARLPRTRRLALQRRSVRLHVEIRVLNGRAVLPAAQLHVVDERRVARDLGADADVAIGPARRADQPRNFARTHALHTALHPVHDLVCVELKLVRCRARLVIEHCPVGEAPREIDADDRAPWRWLRGRFAIVVVVRCAEDGFLEPAILCERRKGCRFCVPGQRRVRPVGLAATERGARAKPSLMYDAHEARRAARPSPGATWS